jgi:hypothetical protein
VAAVPGGQLNQMLVACGLGDNVDKIDLRAAEHFLGVREPMRDSELVGGGFGASGINIADGGQTGSPRFGPGVEVIPREESAAYQTAA